MHYDSINFLTRLAIIKDSGIELTIISYAMGHLKYFKYHKISQRMTNKYL